MRNEEYDAFGPWIDEVADARGVPRLYRDHPLDFGASLLVLKVPRNIERRDADPTMHLYDALIIVTEVDVVVLQRAGDAGDAGYTTRTIAMSSVFAIEDTVHLLDGRFTLHTADGAPLEVSYNGSARETITTLVALVRRLAIASPMTSADVTVESADAESAVAALLPSERDHGLLGDCLAWIRAHPATEVVAGHGTTLLRPRAGGLVALAHRFRPAYLQGAVALVMPDALVVLRRRDWVARGGNSDLSHGTTILFPQRVDAITTTPHPVYPDADVLTMSASGQSLRLIALGGDQFERHLRSELAPVTS